MRKTKKNPALGSVWWIKNPVWSQTEWYLYVRRARHWVSVFDEAPNYLPDDLRAADVEFIPVRKPQL